jgi:hypothetical protein
LCEGKSDLLGGWKGEHHQKEKERQSHRETERQGSGRWGDGEMGRDREIEAEPAFQGGKGKGRSLRMGKTTPQLEQRMSQTCLGGMREHF